MTPGEKPTVAMQQSIILVAAPGQLRNALQNLLSTFAGVNTLGAHQRSCQRLHDRKACADADPRRCRLLVDDRELAHSVMAASMDGSKLLLLAADVEQRRAADPHQSHEVLLKGVRPEVLSDRIESILGSFAG